MSELAAWRHSKGNIKCNVVLTGLSGSGKSALVNALLGDDVKEEPGKWEVKEEPVKLEAKERKGEKHVLNHEANSITFWDTCGFVEQGDPRTDQAFNALEKIPCWKKEHTALIYTISMTKTRFEANSNDIQGMRRLNRYFGHEIWKNAIIVLTQSNEHYKIKTDGMPEDKKKEEYLTKYYKDWDDTLRKHFESIMPKGLAKTVYIIPAGFFKSTVAESEVLESESSGKSWILNVWQHIARVAPMEQKPFLLDVCINKFFAAKFLYSDSYLSLIKLNSIFYQQRVCEIREYKITKEHSQVGAAYSFLHFLLFWVDNYYRIKSKMIKSPCNQSDFAYWTNLDLSVEMIVTGAKVLEKPH